MAVSHRLLLAIFGCLIAGKAHLLFSDEDDWYAYFSGSGEWFAYSMGYMTQQFIICMVIYSLISYKDMLAKTLSFMMVVFPLIEIWLFLPGDMYFEIATITAMVSFLWLGYASFRRYTLPSDELTGDFVYIIAKRPNSFITFLASIVGTPFGRYSYYCNGYVYYYHRDRFKKISPDRYPMEESTILKTNIPATDREIENLNNAVGSKWSLFNNCLTVKLGANNG